MRYTTDLVGRKGIPFELYSNEEFEGATVTIYYDENKIVMELTHFSIYSIVDIIANALAFINPENDITYYDDGIFLSEGYYRGNRYLVMRYRTLPDDMMDKAAVYGGTPLVIDNSEEEEFVLELLKNTTGRFTMGVGYQYSRNRYENHVTGEPIGHMGTFNEPLEGPFHAVFFIEAQTGYWYADWPWFGTRLIVEIEGGSEIDTDGDGIPDANELAGVRATNGNKYFSDPELYDTDGDGLSDGEEIDVQGGRDSQGAIAVLSNPRLNDSDGDGFSDSEDARPFIDNKDAIYIFCLNEFASEGYLMKAKYEKKTTNVAIFVLTFNTADELINLWDTIGLYATCYDQYSVGYYSKPYGDKYYYNPLSVTIDCHGSRYKELIISDNCRFVDDHTKYNGEGYDLHSFNELSNKRMKYLYLLVCYSAFDGRTYKNFSDYASSTDYIMADYFMENNDIRRGIYAYDGISCFAPYVPLTEYFIFTDYIDDEYFYGLIYITKNSVQDVYSNDVVDYDNDSVWSEYKEINDRTLDPIYEFVIQG